MKNLEIVSEVNEMSKAVELTNMINEYALKLTDAKNDGDAESSAFYSQKISEMKNELSELLEENGAPSKEGDKLGYSSDYYQWEYETAIKNGNKIAADNAKKNWASAKAKEDLK